MKEFECEKKERLRDIEELLERYLPKEEGYQKTVLEAMNYSVRAGGKRLRPMLMQETFWILGGRGELVEPFMAALEMIHTYSLVHDDLPAMDNDEYRRGRKTTHAVYGEGMAILAGDGLLNLAFETAVGAFRLARGQEEYERTARALEVLARKAGVQGMIGGQTADVEAEGSAAGEMTMERLLFIHENKTAALLQASMLVGAILAGADEGTCGQVGECARLIGLAFQIQDDILDETGSLEELGKPIGSDRKNAKQTYVTLKGLQEAEAQVESLSRQAMEIIESFEGDTGFLRNLVESLIHRRK